VDTISKYYSNQINALQKELNQLKEQFDTLKDFTFTGQGAIGGGYVQAQPGSPGGGGAAGGPGSINIDMSSMFAGQNAQGPVNVNGNQQVQMGTTGATGSNGMTGGGVSMNAGGVAGGKEMPADYGANNPLLPQQ
jgi:flagellin-like hook-associated protein FlgL